MTNAYPPLTPMNCRFFFVKGDPGSPSAFRFMIDLREDSGDEAGKDVHGSSRLQKHDGDVPSVLVQDSYLPVGAAPLPMCAVMCLPLWNAAHPSDGQTCLQRWQEQLWVPKWTARSSGRHGPAWSSPLWETRLEDLWERKRQRVQAGKTHFQRIIVEAVSKPSACPLWRSSIAAGGLQVSARSGVPTPTTVGCSSV